MASLGNISEVGGHQLELTGTFPAGTDLEVYIGPSGDETDPPAYGGEDRGYRPVSEDGSSVAVVTPPLAPGTHSVSWRTAGSGSPPAVLGTLQVLERNWPAKLYIQRNNFPPWTGVGRRRLEIEGGRW